jgi:hypothetical protein
MRRKGEKGKEIMRDEKKGEERKRERVTYL